MRSYTILLDGTERAQLRRGEKIAITVEPGSYRLEARIDWIKTDPEEVQVGPGETKEFWVKASRTHWSGLRYMFSSNWKWIALEQKSEA